MSGDKGRAIGCGMRPVLPSRPAGGIRLKTWLVAALGLAGLVALIAASMLAASRKVQDIYVELDRLNSHHRRVESRLRALRADIHLSSIFVRDYLLDVARERAPEYREHLAAFREANLATLAELRPLVQQDDQTSMLQTNLSEYWAALDPLFDWTTGEKLAQSASFLRREVLPRRQAVLAIAQGIEELNNQNLVTQQEAVAQRHAALIAGLHRLTWQTILAGLALSLVVVFRLRFLERRSGEADQQMRKLSQQLVNTQEEERKNLSRELHDHIAQLLTGLRMELGRIDRVGGLLDARISPAVNECKHQVDEMFHAVRGLALGLRPSMLDDLGLQAALEWHVRDFTNRYPIDVDLEMDGDFDGLTDKHGTCVYRVVQEALTNCLRHARAQHIRIELTVRNGDLQLTVADDGVGIDPARRHRGLGLRGMDERVRELGGTVTIARGRDGGTVLTARLSLPAIEEETYHARVAG
jgi:signal transduction histidine kinase